MLLAFVPGGRLESLTAALSFSAAAALPNNAVLRQERTYITTRGDETTALPISVRSLVPQATTRLYPVAAP